MVNAPQDSNTKKLFRLIIQNFNLDELKVIFFDLGVDYEDVPQPASKNDYVFYLINFIVANQEQELLLSKLKGLRPRTEWPNKFFVTNKSGNSTNSKESNIKNTETRAFVRTRIKYIDNWINTWIQLVTHPKDFFANNTWEENSYEFAMGSSIVSYAVTIILSIMYFAFFYRNNFVDSLKSSGLETLLILTILFSMIYIVQLFLLFVGGIITSIPYRLLGSNQSTYSHAAMMNYLTCFEPIFAATVALWFLQINDASNPQWMTLFSNYAVVSVFLVSRVLYLIISYIATLQIHTLNNYRNIISYLIAFPFLFIFINGWLPTILMVFIVITISIGGLD